MSTGPSSPESFTREQFLAALHAERAATVDATVPGLATLGQDAALMLALVPGWTSDEWAALGVTATGAALSNAIAALEDAGILEASPERRRGSDATAARVFQITSTGRAALLTPVLRVPARARDLTRDAAVVASRLLANGRSVLDPLRRWAQLALLAVRSESTGGDAPGSPSVRGDAVAQALDNLVNASQDPADVSNWIDAARPLAALLEKASDLHLSLSVDRAGRRLELLHRRRREADRLRFFVKRDEQLNAIRDLVDGADDRWALHLVGGGGVGKTMLLRYLSVTMAEELRASVARVDFDYLTADYPSHAPGELLWNFEEELQLRDETDVVARQFKKANDYLRRLHSELATGPARTTADGLTSPLLKQAIEEYISALRDLPRVILVLDTCEELLRVRPGRSADENIDATFRILAALHDGPRTLEGGPPSATEGLPSLRVILAGRRPLASQGFGWKAQSSLPSRSYLRLLPLRGFTAAEADDYLRVTRGAQPPGTGAPTAEMAPVPENLIGAILDRAPGDVVIPELVPMGGNERRYSPYDLAQYANWASDDPPPSEALIRSATPAQYIERRVLARLRNPELEALVPVLAIVKHADRQLLRSLSTANDERFSAAIERLQHQEWSTELPIKRGDQSRTVYSVDERVRARLAAYYQERPVPQLIAGAAAYLERFTLTTDIADLDWTDVDATLRALDSDQARAARWWLKLERRLLNERDAEWFRKLLDQLFSQDNAAGEPAGDVDRLSTAHRLVLLASLASMTLHTESATAAFTIWNQVAASTSLIADESIKAQLETRSRLGAITGARAGDAIDRSALWKMLDSWPASAPWAKASNEAIAGMLVAAAEAEVERAELEPPGPAELLTAPSGELGPVVLARRIGGAFAASLAGRACALVGRFDAAAKWFTTALTAILPPKSNGLPAFELDWISPSDVKARIATEAIRALYPGWQTPAAIRDLVGAGSVATSGPDNDRFASALMQLRLAESAKIDTRDGFVPAKPERHWRRVYAVVPPGDVSEAEVAAAQGSLDRAVEALRSVLRAPDAIPLDDFVAAQRAMLRLAVRLRLSSEVPSSLVGVRTAEDYGWLWMLTTLDSSFAVPARPQSVERLHEWLHQRLRSAVPQVHRATQDETVRLLASLGLPDRAMEDTWLPLILDLRETELMGHRLGRDSSTWSVAYGLLGRPTATVDIVSAARQCLRVGALFERGSPAMPGGLEQRLSECQSRLGTRRLAEIAFDEGDALAVRLPERAATILQRSLSLFQQCDDAMGTLLASARLGLIAAVARDRDRLTMMLAVTQTAWEMVRRPVGEPAPLVDWTQLTLYARTLSPVIQSTLPPPHSPWRPWALRIVACIAQSSVLQVGGTSVSSFEKWLTASFGSALPPDVAGLVTSETASATAPATAAPPASVTEPGDSAPAAPAGSSSGASLKRDLRAATTHLRDTIRPKASGISVPMPSDSITLSSESPRLWASVPWRPVARIGGGVALLGVVAWGIRLALPLTNASLPFPSGGDPTLLPIPGGELASFSIAGTLRALAGIGVWLALAAAVLAIVATVVGLVWALTRKTYAAAALTELMAESASTSESERSRAVVTAGVTLHIISGSWWRRRPALAEGSCIAGGTRVYGFGAASELSPPLVTALEAMTAYGEVELSIPDGLGAPGWEGALRPSRGSEDLDIRRISPAFLKATPTPRLPRTSVLVCAAGAAEPMVREAWTNLAAAVENEVVITDSPGASNAAVVHLVGTVEETSSGCVIEVAGAGPSATRPFDVSGRLRATDVRDRFPNVQLCVIQAAPVRKLAIRRDATRRDANVVRWFAHDLHARGIPAVIVLPPTEGGQGAALAGMIGSALRQGPLDAQALMRSVRRVRAHLLAVPGVSSSDRWELSCDVCAYCSADWTLEPLQAARRVSP